MQYKVGKFLTLNKSAVLGPPFIENLPDTHPAPLTPHPNMLHIAPITLHSASIPPCSLCLSHPSLPQAEHLTPCILQSTPSIPNTLKEAGIGI